MLESRWKRQILHVLMRFSMFERFSWTLGHDICLLNRSHTCRLEVAVVQHMYANGYKQRTTFYVDGVFMEPFVGWGFKVVRPDWGVGDACA